MKTETYYLNSEKTVHLTTYLLDSSDAMKNAQTKPAVLIMPGGGYRHLSDREAEPIAMAYLAEGFHAFILRYSLNEKASFPTPLKEAEKALALIREYSSEWQVDLEKIAAVGFSAGGHLAAALGTMGEIRPNALVLGYPCILESIGEVLAVPVPSLEKEVDTKTPPAFVFATYEDACVPAENSLEFVRVLNQNKIPYELHIFQTGGHGLALGKRLTSMGRENMVNPSFAKWFSMSVDWLWLQFGEFSLEDEN